MKRFSMLVLTVVLTALLVFALSAFMASCGGGGGGAPVGGNTAPVANAGIDQSVATSSQVTLNGSGSTDANGDTLKYSWSFTSKPGSSATTLSSTTVVNPTFTADKDGAYVLSLVVDDGTVSSTADTVTITALGPGANFKMPDTNQTMSYTTTFGEDHDYTINMPSYTDNNDGSITDNVTGLMWQKCSDGQSGTYCATGSATTYNWYQAAGIAHASYNVDATNVCGNLTLAGQTDWRLPSRIELVSLIDNGVYNPAINTIYFPSTVSSSYWSSTTYAYNTSYAWLVFFSSGNPNTDYKSVSSNSSSANYARCVRGGQ